MKEFFEKRTITGTIALTLSNKTKWRGNKGLICVEIDDIVTRYEKQGYRLTLRQLYYQLVSADAIPNDDVMYKKLSGILDDMRYSGLIDWSSIEDRGRVPYIPYSADSAADAMGDLIAQFRLDRMQGQNNMVEVWTEKDAISGILKRATSKFHVQLIVNKGYSSSSAMHVAYMRFAQILNSGRSVTILYFGDHDPSGLDMVRDISDRILFFLVAGEMADFDEIKNADGEDVEQWWQREEHDIYTLYDEDYYSEHILKDLGDFTKEPREKSVEAFDRGKRMKFLKDNNIFRVIPIGLTMEQIMQYKPPPNPAKISDPRAAWYIEQFGEVSWEVDALSPEIMERLVSDKIAATIDMQAFQNIKDQEESHKEKMRTFQKSLEE